MKKKILVILDSDLYIRNYIDTGVINHLKKFYDLEILFSKKIVNTKKLLQYKSIELKTYQFDKISENLFFFLNDITIFLNRKKSSSFVLRIENHFNKISFINKFVKIISFNKFIFYILKQFLNLYLLKFNSIKKHILKNNYDLVIFPSSGLDLMSYYLPHTTNNTRTKNFFLIDNWDNISSKSYYINKPNYLGVWGEQSKEHACRIQDFDKKKIFSVGTPRFDVYKDKSKFKKIYKYRYILFLGSSMLSQEQEILTVLNKILENNQTVFKKLKVVYRPHPWRKKQDTVSLNSLNHIIIDRQLKDMFKKNFFKNSFQPNLKYYPKLIDNAELVMGGLTSMMVESLIMKKKYLAFIFNDKDTFYNPKKRMDGMEHFKILKKIKNVKFCNTLNYNIVEKNLKNAWKYRKKLNIDNSNYFVNKIVASPTPSYKENLVKLINSII